MGCRILSDVRNEMACYYDSVTDTAFGPIFHDLDRHGLDAESILQILLEVNAFGRDPRVLDYDDIDAVRSIVLECENAMDEVRLANDTMKKAPRVKAARAIKDAADAASRAKIAASKCPLCLSIHSDNDGVGE